MTLGLTYTRGRTTSTIGESVAGVTTPITRVAGQFSSPMLSCPVRSAGQQLVTLTVGSVVTPTSGAMIFYFDPDNNHNGASQHTTSYLFHWRTDASNIMHLTYDKTGTRWIVTRLSGGAGATVVLTDTFNAGDPMAVYVGWDATNLYVAVDGGAITSGANSSIPTLPATLSIGTNPLDVGFTSAMNAAYGAVLMFSAPLTLAQWQGLAALRALRAPLFGEWAKPTAVWYGAHQEVWSLDTNSEWLDFYNTSGLSLHEFNNGGIAMPLHRVIETPLRDGGTYVDTRLQPRHVDLGLILQGTTVDATFDLRRQVSAGLNPRRGQGLLSFSPYDQLYELTAMTESLPFAGNTAQFLRTQARLLCTDPAWRKVARALSVFTIPQGGWSIPWTIPWSITESAVTQNVTNDGDLDTYPTVIVTAGTTTTLDGPGIQNVTTGDRFHLRGLVLQTQEYVTIDMDARTAIKSDGTNVLGYRTIDSRMWALQPGVNSVKAFTDAGSAVAKMSLTSKLVGV